jgi:hypothetical protein
MSYMKRINAREFQHHFGKLTETLKPGEFIQITKRGRVDGIYQKAPRAAVKQPNFLEITERHTYPEAVGARLLKQLDEALS